MLRLGLAFALVAVAAAAPSARAAGLRGVVLPPQLGAHVDASWQAGIAERLVERLRAEHAELVLPADLTDAERGCREVGCLAALAERRQADVILGANVVGDGSGTFFVTVFSYDRARPSFVGKHDAVCPRCSASQVEDVVGGLVTKALAMGPGTPEGPAPSSSARRPALAALGVVAAVGAVGSAVGLVVEATRNGQPSCDASFPPGERCPFQRDTTVGMAIAGAATGVLAVAAVGLFIAAARTVTAPNPVGHARRPSLWAAPFVAPTGGGLALGGRY